MMTKQITEFLGEWSTQLNTNQQAGALVQLQNGIAILRIKNKSIQPFYCLLKSEEGQELLISPTTRFNYSNNLSDTIQNKLTGEEFQNYHFGQISISGELKNDFELISMIIAHEANKFFGRSKFHTEKISSYKNLDK